MREVKFVSAFLRAEGEQGQAGRLRSLLAEKANLLQALSVRTQEATEVWHT